jgi:pimeloyl-ACP methyl ester carboxylesterase
MGGGVAPKAGEDGLSASVIPCDQQFIPEPDCQDPGPPSGGGINPSDSHVAANVVQSFTTTIIDDATGASTVMESPAVPLTIEAGYSYSGSDVVQYVYPDGGASDGVAVIRLDGQTAVELDANGGAAAASPGDLDGQTINPLTGMPDLSMFPSVIDAIAGGTTAQQLVAVNATVMQLSRGVSVRLSDPTHLQLSIATGVGGTTNGGAEVSFERPRGSDRWVMRRLDAQSTIAESGKRATMRSRVEFRGMRVARNIDSDKLRDAKKSRRFDSFRDATWNQAPSPAPATKQVVAADESWSRTGIIQWNPPVTLPFPVVPITMPNPGLGSSFDDTDEDAGTCNNDTYPATQAVPYSPSGRHIVFQHGFNSKPCTWAYQVPFFADYATGGRVVGRTNSFATYESQASELRSQIPSNTTNWVLVGHSNGGIISRYLSQTQGAGFARAVITVNSPHQGAPVFSGRVGAFLSRVQFMTAAAQTIFARRSAGATSMGILVSPKSFLRAVWNGDGTLVSQIATGSAFQANLATRPEAFFRRYAIRSQVSTDWVSMRVYCDGHPATSPGVPDGRRCVEDAKRTVKRHSVRGGIFGLLSIVASRVSYLNILSGSLRYTAVADAALVSVMYAIEWAYKDLFTDNLPSDGVVPMTSQRWSGLGANAERVIQNADSHVGSTKSELVKVQLDDLLRVAYR